MRKTLTKKYLLRIGASEEAVQAFEAQPIRDTRQILLGLYEQERYEWANWLLCRVMSRRQRIKYAIHAAEPVLPIFEAAYPGDDRPRKAIKAARAYLAHPSPKTRSAAESAADSAWSAARSAADSAARSAARSAAESAWSAWSARSAAESAESAWSAAESAESASWSATRRETLAYGYALVGIKVSTGAGGKMR